MEHIINLKTKELLIMKKTAILTLCLIIPFTFSFISCKDDEDIEENISKNDGKIQIAFGDVSTGWYYANYSEYNTHPQIVIGTAIYKTKGYSFSTKLYKVENQTIMFDYDWHFDIYGNIEPHQSYNVNGIVFQDRFDYSSFLYHDEEAKNKVYVKSFNNDEITLSFNDFCFDRYYDGAHGQTSQPLTINGEITYHLDSYEQMSQ